MTLCVASRKQSQARAAGPKQRGGNEQCHQRHIATKRTKICGKQNPQQTRHTLRTSHRGRALCCGVDPQRTKLFLWLVCYSEVRYQNEPVTMLQCVSNAIATCTTNSQDKPLSLRALLRHQSLEVEAVPLFCSWLLRGAPPC